LFGWLLRDFLFLLPLVLLAILWLIVRRNLPTGVRDRIVYLDGGWLRFICPGTSWPNITCCPLLWEWRFFWALFSEIAREALSMAQSRMRWVTVFAWACQFYYSGDSVQ